MEEIDENIKVGAVFQGSKIIPKWFVWDGTKYIVKAINYIWNDRCGREKIILFSVSTDANTYELAYYTEQCVWKLSKIQ